MIASALFSFAALAPLVSVTAAPSVYDRNYYVTPPPGPKGGLGLNKTPEYIYKSDFDFQSLNLALNQEFIELDLFHHGRAMFSDQEFYDAGFTDEDLYLLQFMADQEVGHATVVQNMLQGKGAQPCKYTYPFKTVREFVDFSQKLTRWGESGVYGFLEHLDSRAAAEILLQSITTEARQQMVFRQWEGLFPMPIWHTTGITQSMAWTLLAPYIASCPAGNPRIEWTNFPGLNITNNPDAITLNKSNSTGQDNSPAITHNRTTPLSASGREVYFVWEEPGKKVGYNSSYITNKTAKGAPKFAAWISQLNVTYTELYDINGTTAKTKQPGGQLYSSPYAENNRTFPILNGTQFVLISDKDLYVTPFNLSYLNEHVVAGPAMYQSG